MNSVYNMSKINNMKLRVFGGICMNGYKTDVMKSGLQKYIRRGELIKALYCMVELDMFKKLGDRKVKGLRSNLRNRLIIILAEDIGIADWTIYKRCADLFKLWEENRNSEDDCERKYLIEIISYLARSEKIRLCSHIKGYFSYIYENEEMKKKYCSDINMKENKMKDGVRFYKKGDEEEVKRFIDGITSCLDLNDDRVFYWIMKLLKSDAKNGRRGRRGKKGFIVWDIIKDYIAKSKNKNLMDLYNMNMEWYVNNNNSRGENLLYLINLVLFYLRRNKIDWSRKLKKINITDENVKKIYEKNMSDYKFVVDDYVIDMHCSQGKKEGKGASTFANEGAYVKNENKTFLVKKYKDSYTEYKLKNSDKKKKVKKEKNVKNEKKEKKEKKVVKSKKKVVKKRKPKMNMKMEEELEFIDFKKLMDIGDVKDLNKKLCREKTCGNKVMTFINKKKKIIVKEMRKSFNYGRDCCIVDEVKDLFKIKKLNCRRVMSNMVVRKVDSKNGYWKDNMELKEEKAVYLIMDTFDNIGTLVDNKKIRSERLIRNGYMKIILFRSIFRVTDSNYTNVLVNIDYELLSIDENNIGNKKDIFDRRTSKCYTETDIKKCLDSILKNKEEKLALIKKKLEKYEMGYLYADIEKRMNTLREDVNKKVGKFLA